MGTLLAGEGEYRAKIEGSTFFLTKKSAADHMYDPSRLLLRSAEGSNTLCLLLGVPPKKDDRLSSMCI